MSSVNQMSPSDSANPPVDGYDRFLPDEYTRRLGKINESNRVIASSDIVNASGALVVAKGTEISANVAEKILKHRLNASLEEQISLTRSMSGDDLHQEFKLFLELNEDYQKLHSNFGNDQLLHDLCRYYANYPLLVQKMTVFAAEMRTEFPRALFCAWLAQLLAVRLELPELERPQIFLAALFQDIGLLHLPSNVLHAAGNPALTKMYSSHPLISATFLKMVPYVPETIASLARIHHEDFEGTGFPYEVAVQKLPVASQILVACNLLYEYMHGTDNPSFMLGQLRPVFRVFSSIYHRGVFSELFTFASVCTQSLPDIASDADRYKALVSSLLFKHPFLARWFKEVQVITVKLWEVTKGKNIGSLMNIAQSIRITVSSTGVLSEGMARWVSHVEETLPPEAAEEMQDILMLQWILEGLLSRYLVCLESLLTQADPGLQRLHPEITKTVDEMTTLREHLCPEAEDDEDALNLESLFSDS
ncbi:MAG: hypothetical protein H6999_07505 [Hahellaceae bacterium]|nr:hypothetical protein [Hahellaceae bacterium]